MTTLITPKELEVAELLSLGKTRDEIAGILGVSPKTAGAHLLNMYRKLDVHSAAQATRTLIEMGYIKVGVTPIPMERFNDAMDKAVKAAFAVLACEMRLAGRG